MHRSLCAAAWLLCAVLLFSLAGCASAPASSSAPGEMPPAASSLPEPEKPPVPAYTGPLYEISVEELPEPIDSMLGPQAAEGIFYYEGEIVYTYPYGSPYFFNSDGTLLNFQLGIPYQVDGITDNFYLLSTPHDPDNLYEYPYYVTDHDGNITAMIPHGITLYFDFGRDFVWAAKEGFLPYRDEQTNEFGILDLATGACTPIGHDYIFKRHDPAGELPKPLPIISISGTFCFSEGLAPVQFRDRSNCFYTASDLGNTFGGAVYEDVAYVCECDFAGFIDYKGELAFSFRDIPELADCIVTDVSGYMDGKCIIETRPLDRSLLTGTFDWLRQWSEFSSYYQIDCTGAILGESSLEEFNEYHGAVAGAELDVFSTFAAYDASFGDQYTRASSILVRDGLVAKADETGVFFEDANGTVYPIPMPEECNAVNVFGQGDNVWVFLSQNDHHVYNWDSYDVYTHIVRIRSIMPEDYTVAQDFCDGRPLLGCVAAPAVEVPPIPEDDDDEDLPEATSRGGGFYSYSPEDFAIVAQKRIERETAEQTARKEAEEAAGGILRLRMIP